MVKKDKSSNRSKEDLALVKRAVEKRDQAAFKDLMDRYRDSIFFMILKIVHNRNDAEDLTIEAFGKAFNNIKKYDQRYAFSTWLYKIATNASIDFIRKKRLETTSLDKKLKGNDGDEMTIDVKSEALNPEEKLVKQQRAFSVRGNIEKLDDKYKQLIKLRYYEEYSYDEIAKELDLPLGTVKAQLYRAKELLFKQINDHKDKI